MMRSQLLTSVLTMAVISAARAASEGVEVETDRITNISFSKQVEGAMGLTQKGDESKQEENEEKASDTNGSDKPDTSRKESKHILSSDSKSKSKRSSLSSSVSDSKSRSRSRNSSDEWFVEGICDPDNTANEDLALCEDIWETICNPDDEVPVADDLCDWLGFTADVDWYEGEDLDFQLEYVKIAHKEKAKMVSSSTHSKSRSQNSPTKKSRNGRFVEGMCDPDKSKHSEEDICNEVWDSLCNPDDEMEVDDDFCDWIGFTADVDWDYSSVDYFEDEDDEYDASDSSDSYGSKDRAPKNLRG